MTRINKKSRDNYATVKGNPKNKTRKKWIFILFILMIVITIVGFYIYFQYTSIKESYQNHLYTSEIIQQDGEVAVVEGNKPYTILLVALDNIYVEGAQIEEALWSTLLYVNPDQTTIQSVTIPLNLVVEDDSKEQALNTYGTGGIGSIKETLSDLFEVQLDYLSVVRLQNLREVIDPLNTIQIQAPYSIEGNGLKIESGKRYELTGRETEQLISLANTLPTLEQAKLHQTIFDGIIGQTIQLDKIVQLPELLSNGEYVVQSDIPFGKLVEIYRNDDYNLTTVDLDELVELDLTQIDNRDLYIADLADVKEVVQRMATAIEETAK